MDAHEPLPATVREVLARLVEGFQTVLGPQLTGIYLHGSLCMGCFNPATSDIDVLVVVAEPLTLAQKQACRALLQRCEPAAPAKGFELSLVTRPNVLAFRHPTPFEWHAPSTVQDDHLTEERTDPDLAAHFTVLKARGRCLYGEAIPSVFPDIPYPAYLDSVARDAAWSFEQIVKGPDDGDCRVPVYGVLNFCRVLSLVKDRQVRSKAEGGRWALQYVPQTYRPLVEAALAEYAQQGVGRPVGAAVLKAFARYANERIQDALTRAGQSA